jgi:hypothetical protein
MIRCATLAALCAFGLTNVAHASVAVTMQDTSTWVANVTVLQPGALEFNSAPVAAFTESSGLPGGAQPISAIPNSGGGDLSLSSPGGSIGIGDIHVDLSSGTLTLSNGGNLQLNQGALDLTSPLITADGGSGSGRTITISPPVNVAPIEPPPGGWITPPFFPTPAPTYPQQAGMACSGAFSVTFGAQTTVNCQADLWFTNGYVAANQSIVANALGNIPGGRCQLRRPRDPVQCWGQLRDIQQPHLARWEHHHQCHGREHRRSPADDTHQQPEHQQPDHQRQPDHP